MRFWIPLLLMLTSLASCRSSQELIPADPIAAATQQMLFHRGFFPMYHDTTEGRILIEIRAWDEEFLYVHALRHGLGSNDIGLDRGQLGDQHVVKFIRRGRQALLLQPNYAYRAVGAEDAEARSVREAFAVSVLGGFEILASHQGRALIDLTDWLLQDRHGVADRLSDLDQGSFRLDPSRSAIEPYWTRNFPDNSEFDALLTFSGRAEGGYLRSVLPDPTAVTVWQHHSFVRLPDEGYAPRPFDPRSGYMTLSYQDYATPIDQPLTKRFILRHRLEKRDPTAAESRPVEPIIYYLDPGCPEPIRSALLEGAAWWNQAFEAAGYVDAFRVEMLPEHADPLDVRYNVIQWVHRSTRGWSYGSSVIDPRTGEIIKGHVSLGSLRVRQDFLIAQGLLDAYPEGGPPSPGMKQLALARLRQLSAHEVGHTLGLVHNYVASTDGRASVMDYPHPYVTQLGTGQLNFSQAYDQGIGEWDQRAIMYGYQDFPEGTDEATALADVLAETEALGWHFLSDEAARPTSSVSSRAHLWDNGSEPAEELHRLLTLRDTALARFGAHQVPMGTPLAELEEVLVPLYFGHRFQVEATAKVLAGMDYAYAVRDSSEYLNAIVSPARQRAALEALLRSLDPQVLAMPTAVLDLIPPRPRGYGRPRETFATRTQFTLDPIANAEVLADHTLSLMLHPARLARLVEFSTRQAEPVTVTEVFDALWSSTWQLRPQDAYDTELVRSVQLRLWEQLLQTAAHPETHAQVRALAYDFLRARAEDLREDDWYRQDPRWLAHRNYALHRWEQFLSRPEAFEPAPVPPMPDGSPIGSACQH